MITRANLGFEPTPIRSFPRQIPSPLTAERHVAKCELDVVTQTHRPRREWMVGVEGGRRKVMCPVDGQESGHRSRREDAMEGRLSMKLAR